MTLAAAPCSFGLGRVSGRQEKSGPELDTPPARVCVRLCSLKDPVLSGDRNKQASKQNHTRTAPISPTGLGRPPADCLPSRAIITSDLLSFAFAHGSGIKPVTLLCLLCFLNIHSLSSAIGSVRPSRQGKYIYLRVCPSISSLPPFFSPQFAPRLTRDFLRQFAPPDFSIRKDVLPVASLLQTTRDVRQRPITKWGAGGVASCQRTPEH